MDVTKEKPIDRVTKREIQRVYTDYSGFKIRVESLEEILAEKLRALLERKKCRDYYDIWKLLELRTDKRRVPEIFVKKCKIKGTELSGIDQFFPKDLEEILRP